MLSKGYKRVLFGRGVKECWLEEGYQSSFWKKGERLEERESECCLEEGQESAVWKNGERVLLEEV